MKYTDVYIEQQLAAIQRVRELHFDTADLDTGADVCAECVMHYPCATIRVLDGEQE
jgi:hypothetical protein